MVWDSSESTREGILRLRTRLKQLREKMKDTYRKPIKQGYLLKQSQVLKKWHLRYFILSKECLCYYRTEKESLEDAPKEVIFFNDLSMYIDEFRDKQTKYCLRIVKRSFSAKIPARTFLLCSFSEDERNEWLTGILHAKAMTLVADPTAWMQSERQEKSTEHLDFELAHSRLSSVRLASAKDVLQKCRSKFSLTRGTRASMISLISEDLNMNKIPALNKSLTLNQRWRSTIIVS